MVYLPATRGGITPYSSAVLSKRGPDLSKVSKHLPFVLKIHVLAVDSASFPAPSHVTLEPFQICEGGQSESL